MRLVTFKTLACAVLALQAASASAFFDVQVMAGKRWYERNDSDGGNVAAQETGLAAHLDPIPLVPVGFGVYATMSSLDKDAFGAGTDTAAGLEAGLDIMAWLPMVPIITPYARLKYPFMSTWAVEGEQAVTASGPVVKTASSYAVSGPHVGIGAKWSPLPIVKLLVEAQMGSQKIELDELEIAGVKTKGGDSSDLKSNAFLIGLEIGL